MGIRVAAALAISLALGAAGSAQAAIQPVQYFSGPVMHSQQFVLVEWGPNAPTAFTAAATGDPAFFGYLASQSGTTTDPGAVLAQYGDDVGGVAGNASNDVSYGGAIEITPTKGSGPAAATITDAEIQTQLESSIGSGALPEPLDNGLGTLYVVLFPMSDTIEAANGDDSLTGFCAYHSTTPTSPPLIYAVMPDTNGVLASGHGCGKESMPLQNETSALSHEYAESVTDPEIGLDTQPEYASPGGWASNLAGEGEVADICDTGQASENSSIDVWTVQKVWSNIAGEGCEASEPAYSAPTATITPPTDAIAATSAAFSGDGSSDPGSNTIVKNNGLNLTAPLGPGIVSYDWVWGDGTPDSTGADPSHTFAQGGDDTVTLTVTDVLGFTGTATADVTVSNPAAPDVATAPATLLSDTGATLNGTIDPWGHATTYDFEYGTSPLDLDQTTASAPAGDGTTVEDESATLGDLTPGTTYYYRLVASFGASTSAGNAETFTTTGAPPPPPAPIPATVAATNLGTTAASLNGTIDPDGLPVTYDFAWGTSAGALTKTTPVAGGPSGTTSLPVHAELSGLTSGTTYYYRLEVQSGGKTYSGDVLSLTTRATPATVSIGAPSNVSATAATLFGAIDPNGFATSYLFEYGTTSAYGQSTAVTSAGHGTTPQVVSAPIGGLGAMTLYHYRLVATSPGGPVTTPDRTLTTLAPPPPAPRFAFKTASGQTLHSALRHGIRITFSCNVACSASFALRRASGKLADIGAVPIDLATGGAKLAHGGHGTATLRLTAPGRKAFKHSRRIRLIVDGAAANTAGIAGRPLVHALSLR